jgi:hypothetical protein
MHSLIVILDKLGLVAERWMPKEANIWTHGIRSSKYLRSPRSWNETLISMRKCMQHCCVCVAKDVLDDSNSKQGGRDINMAIRGWSRFFLLRHSIGRTASAQPNEQQHLDLWGWGWVEIRKRCSFINCSAGSQFQPKDVCCGIYIAVWMNQTIHLL